MDENDEDVTADSYHEVGTLHGIPLFVVSDAVFHAQPHDAADDYGTQEAIDYKRILKLHAAKREIESLRSQIFDYEVKRDALALAPKDYAAASDLRYVGNRLDRLNNTLAGYEALLTTLLPGWAKGSLKGAG